MSSHGFTEVKINNSEIYSEQFDDIYHSCDGSIAESEYVFLHGNELPTGWQGRSHYCIAETGFGSGLNFLVTLKAWQADPHRCERLDYFAIEGYPLHAHQLKQIYTHWPELAAETNILLTQYPPIAHGIHSLSFESGRVQLHLIFNEVLDALKEINLKPDCWYLDGFAPSKNPQMWRPDVLNAIARRSKPNTRLATFTVAGVVRRNLIAAGFDIYKRKGYGRKREMLCARGLLSTAPGKQAQRNTSPWFQLPESGNTIRHAAVIGAGIAGAQIAHHLAQRGIRVTVFEAQAGIANGASGNAAGILAPKLDARRSELEDFYLSAFLYQLRQIQHLENQGAVLDFEQCGLLSIAHTDKKHKRLEQLVLRDDLPENIFQLLKPQQVSGILGEACSHSGMINSLAGALAPRSLCQALLSHPDITLNLGAAVERIHPDRDKPGIQLAGGDQQLFDAVVLANGYQANEFSGAIELTPVRGQTSSAAMCGEHLKHAIEHQGYLLRQPKSESGIVFGASHIRNECDTRLQDSETSSNIEMFSRQTPELAGRLEQIQSSHAGIRATTEDRWPLLGGIPDSTFYRTAYADLHFGKHYQPYPPAQYHPGIYLLSGLGSRGLCSAAWCASILSRIICGETPPANNQVLRALHPARFMIRALKKHAP